MINIQVQVRLRSGINISYNDASFNYVSSMGCFRVTNKDVTIMYPVNVIESIGSYKVS